MKTPRHATPPRAVRPGRERAKPNCEQSLQACEEAAARIKSAGDELAACWRALVRELSAGVPATELLRTRAWCNILELRLKEQAHALEEARRSADAVWDELMNAARGRQLLSHLLNPEALPADGGWSLLAQTAYGALGPAADALHLKD